MPADVGFELVQESGRAALLRGAGFGDSPLRFGLGRLRDLNGKGRQSLSRWRRNRRLGTRGCGLAAVKEGAGGRGGDAERARGVFGVSRMRHFGAMVVSVTTTAGGDFRFGAGQQ